MKARTTTSALSWLRKAIALTAVFAGSAHAAYYSGAWDPPFGSPFPNLGWRGTAQFYVPPSCEPSGSANVLNFPTCAGGAVVTAAQVQLYDDSAVGDPTVATLNFTPGSFFVFATQFTSGELTQVFTTPSNLLNPPEDLSDFGVAPQTEFSLFFTFGIQGFYDGPHLAYRTCSYRSSALTHYDGPSTASCDYGLNSSADGFRPALIISRVPEPASLWLASLALFGVVVSSRRQRGGR